MTCDSIGILGVVLGSRESAGAAGRAKLPQWSRSVWAAVGPSAFGFCGSETLIWARRAIVGAYSARVPDEPIAGAERAQFGVPETRARRV